MTLGLACGAAINVGAQERNDTCPKIIVSAPESVTGNGVTFNISAKFEGIAQPTTNFDWTVMRESGTATIMSKQWIELEIDRPEEPELIIAVATPSDIPCKGFGISKTLAFPHQGSPNIINEYQASRWADEKARLDDAAIVTNRSPDSELFINVAFAVSERGTSKREYLERVANYLLSGRKLTADRITFAISTTKGKRNTKLQLQHAKMMSGFPFFDELIVRCEDLTKLKSLFGNKK